MIVGPCYIYNISFLIWWGKSAHGSEYSHIYHKDKSPGGQGSHRLIESPFLQPAILIYLSILILNIFTLLGLTQYVDNCFHSFIVLCENEFFLISNLH